jgi:hypothetical protein
LKIVLSRKGFDSAYGRRPSPIFPDGHQVSLPIPMPSGSPTRFADLACAHGPLGVLVEQLTRGGVAADEHCHLDPDLDPASCPRAYAWRPAFGQVGAAQSHLARHRVGPDDLFLFFGWFRRVEYAAGCWRYVRSARSVHRLFGWLQVGEVLRVGRDVEAARARWPWLAHHPHLHGVWDASNTVYAAVDRLSVPGLDIDLPGAGCFRTATPQLTLTDPDGRSRSVWRLPGWFLPHDGVPTLSFHGDARRWSRCGDRAILASAPIGQEFVFDAAHCPEAAGWLADLFAGEARTPAPTERRLVAGASD